MGGSLRRRGAARRDVDPDGPADEADPAPESECRDRTCGFLGMANFSFWLVMVSEERQAGLPPLGELVEVEPVVGVHIAVNEALPHQP